MYTRAKRGSKLEKEGSQKRIDREESRGNESVTVMRGDNILRTGPFGSNVLTLEKLSKHSLIRRSWRFN